MFVSLRYLLRSAKKWRFCSVRLINSSIALLGRCCKGVSFEYHEPYIPEYLFLLKRGHVNFWACRIIPFPTLRNVSYFATTSKNPKQPEELKPILIFENTPKRPRLPQWGCAGGAKCPLLKAFSLSLSPWVTFLPEGIIVGF